VCVLGGGGRRHVQGNVSLHGTWVVVIGI